MLRFIFIYFFLCLFMGSIYAQQTTPEEGVKQLHEALIKRDSVVLENILHTQLSYSHSNGWTETKTELIQNNQSGHLVYKTISCDRIDTELVDNVAIVRFKAIHDVVLQGQALTINLLVLQTWIKQDENWVLLARQSTKLNL